MQGNALYAFHIFLINNIYSFDFSAAVMYVLRIQLKRYLNIVHFLWFRRENYNIKKP